MCAARGNVLWRLRAATKHLVDASIPGRPVRVVYADHAYVLSDLTTSIYLPRGQMCRNQEHLLRQKNLVGLNYTQRGGDWGFIPGRSHLTGLWPGCRAIGEPSSAAHLRNSGVGPVVAVCGPGLGRCQAARRERLFVLRTCIRIFRRQCRQCDSVDVN